MAQFIVVKHDAKRRGIHYDLRFEIPKSNLWASFATPKSVDEIPEKEGKRINLIRTHDHKKDEALFTGKIEDGYGAGTLTKYDSGKCEVIKYTNAHIVVDFKGNKIKGKYHFINTMVFSKDKKNKRIYRFFKSSKED